MRSVDVARSSDRVKPDHLPVCPVCGDLCEHDATVCPECGRALLVESPGADVLPHLDEATLDYIAGRATRDYYIRQAARAGLSTREIAKHARISHTQVARIVKEQT